jgi:hypothetical protein
MFIAPHKNAIFYVGFPICVWWCIIYVNNGGSSVDAVGVSLAGAV